MHRQEPNKSRSITALSVVHSLDLCAKNEGLSHLVGPELGTLNEFVLKCLIKDYPISKGWLVYKGLSVFPANFQKKIMDHCGGIGAPQHIAMRKLFIEQQVRQAIDQGAKQVLIVGAGYDLLAARLHSEFSDVKFIELERGDTRKTKLAIIDSLVAAGHIQKKDNLIFHECDLSIKDWQKSLPNIGFDKTKKSIAILEGLTMYLTPEQNSDLLLLLKKEVLCDGSKIILSFNETNKSITENKAFASLVAESGEEYLSELKPDEVVAYAQKMQLSMLGKALSLDLQKNAGNGAAIEKIRAENILVENYYLLSTTAPNRDNTYNHMSDVPNVEILVPTRNENTRRCNLI